ncbi:5'-nucleotidase C-terminal domain-containing protein [bacterium]|nr:5'-nucleotidase C-terminal domain-containing protein [bacterium]
MINSISKSFSAQQQPQNRTQTSIFYVNDIHGRTSNMEKITSASQNFDAFIPSSIDKLKMCSGDTMLGQNEKVNKSANIFLNVNNFMASVIGNHECDQDSNSLLNLMKEAKYKILGKNITQQEGSKFKDKITSSYIQEVNGNKYGVIALMPYDLFLRLKRKDEYGSNIQVNPLEQTIKDVQQEVDTLKEKGVNKVIVLSHTGYEQEVKLAKAVEGIDVILGGHSHDLITGLEEGKNVFYSEKTGEPTIITQAGRDGNHFGILNVEFDENGVITKAQNNVVESTNFQRNMAIQAIFDTIMGKAQVIGKIESADPMPKQVLKEENPHASFIADVIRKELNTDIGMINAANLRGCFEAGRITDRDVSSTTPFKNTMLVINLTEKEVVDTIKYSCSSMTKNDGKPGLMQVSGLKYTVNKQGELLDLTFIDKDGKEVAIDINNPRSDKKYSVGVDDFCGKGRDGYTMMNKFDEPDTKIFDFDKDKLAIDYIKKQTEPIHIKKDGRIKIVD